MICGGWHWEKTEEQIVFGILEIVRTIEAVVGHLFLLE